MKQGYIFWGENIKPLLPFARSVEEIFQGWRDNQIVREMAVLRCPKCRNIFFIMRDECQKELDCPRGCGAAVWVSDKDRLLAKLLKEIHSNEGLERLASGCELSKHL